MQARYLVPTRQFMVSIPVCAASVAMLLLALTGTLGRIPRGYIPVSIVVFLGVLLIMAAQLFTGRALWYPPAKSDVLMPERPHRYHLAELRTTRTVGLEVRLTYEASDDAIPPMEVVLEDGEGGVLMASGRLAKRPRTPCVYVTCLPGTLIDQAHMYLELTAPIVSETVVRAEVYPVFALARNRVYVHGGIENWRRAPAP